MTAARKTPDTGIEGLAPPRTIDVVAGGQTLHIAPASISNLAAMLRDGKDVYAALGDQPLTQLFADHTEALIDICTHGTGISRDDIADMNGDEFLSVLSAVLEANADFFIHRLRPALESLFSQLHTAIVPQNSAPPSSD